MRFGCGCWWLNVDVWCDEAEKAQGGLWLKLYQRGLARGALEEAAVRKARAGEGKKRVHF